MNIQQQQITEEVTNIKLRLENFTAMADLNEEIDLRTLFSKLKGAKMGQSFTSIQFEIIRSCIQVTIFQTGIITVLGCPTLYDVENSFKLISKILKRLKLPYHIQQYQIYQALATGYFPDQLNLELLFKKLPNAHYNPEIFPGLQMRHNQKDLNFYLTVMSNGSFVIGGLAGERQIRRALQLIINEIKECYIQNQQLHKQ